MDWLGNPRQVIRKPEAGEEVGVDIQVTEKDRKV